MVKYTFPVTGFLLVMIPLSIRHAQCSPCHQMNSGHTCDFSMSNNFYSLCLQQIYLCWQGVAPSVCQVFTREKQYIQEIPLIIRYHIREILLIKKILSISQGLVYEILVTKHEQFIWPMLARDQEALCRRQAIEAACFIQP